MLPVQITVRDMPSSPALEDHLRKKAHKLDQYYDRINSCKIVIHIPQKHKHQGKLFSVNIDLSVPGKELIVNRKLDEDVYIAIRDAFHAVQRQLESYACKRRGDVKLHELLMHGFIKKIFFDSGYGFIQGAEGSEYYFSPTNVSYPGFEQLQLGDIVQFVGVPQSEGMQAHRITKVSDKK
ncbi:MAG TPA: ribosome-associated translation inhibitor RaiA [Gammaproteobacteria bacterium]|nr:ribosome-associated translation inhibitor RaiA [Gammaproteobacteria bacterium]